MVTNITAIVAGTAAAAAAAVVGAGFAINWTTVLAILTISLTTMGTLIKLFGPKNKINDENLRESHYLIQLESDMKEKESRLSHLKELVNEQHTDLEKLKIEMEHGSKSLSELKQDNRDLVQRLDDLLKQFMEYMEGS